MKRIILSLAGAMTLSGAAFAETATVSIPANVQTPEGAAIYTAALDRAVTRVCRNEFSPIVGVNYYSYRTCLTKTRADLARQEPTGLYAARLGDSGPSLALAAK